ncbi:hypothetical protein BrevBR_08240 [Brevundimonas sp. BR2-1]|uniref:hypothetical protein n=1 Tax=Brevundimonas sp. BR2-1 TaxID=3031123 RepID=UPI0030A0167C
MTKLLGELRADEIAEDQTVDGPGLAAAVSVCFRMARDGRYSSEARTAFYDSGVMLRDQMKILLAEVFNEGTDDLLEANALIKTVNADLAATLADVNRAADTIEQLGALVTQLTKLVELGDVLI